MRPICRSATLALKGRLQTIPPVRSIVPSTSATTSGPPANPSDTRTPPGSGRGRIPRSSPRASPRPKVRMSTSLAAR